MWAGAAEDPRRFLQGAPSDGWLIHPLKPTQACRAGNDRPQPGRLCLRRAAGPAGAPMLPEQQLVAYDAWHRTNKPLLFLPGLVAKQPSTLPQVLRGKPRRVLAEIRR